MTEFILADCGIRQLHARFNDAVARQDAEDFGDCFAEDGEWKIAGMHFRSRAEIVEIFGKLMTGCDRVQVIAGTPILEVASGKATGRLQITELAKMSDGSSAMTLGDYYDRYVEKNGVWRFQWRHFGLKYRGPIDLSEGLVDSPNYGPFPGMPEPDEPTMTRRALDD